MKKLFIAVTLGCFAFTSFSKQDDSPTPLSSCLVPVNHQKTSYFLNIGYIRHLKIETSTLNTLSIGMASNYGHSSSIDIVYNNPKEARDAMIDLVSRVNSCHKK